MSIQRAMGRVRARRPRRGAAAVEFVLTAPILVLLLFGTIEFGNFFSTLVTLNGLAQDAARYGARATTQVEATIQAELAMSQLIEDMAVPCGGGCIIDADMETRGGINYVVLRVEIPYDSLTGAAPGRGSGGVELPLAWNIEAAYPHVGASILASGT